MNKKIEKAYNLFREMEKKFPSQKLLNQDLDLLKSLLISLKEEKDVDLQRLYHIHLHLHLDMSQKEFSYWLIPLERYLKKDLKDDDFLIFNKDHEERKEYKKTLPVVVILDHVRSSFNVGSIFRSCEAFHIEKIYLVGYTPDPTNSKTKKTTLGADEFIPWETVPKISPLIEKLHQEHFHVIAAETTSHATPLHHPFNHKKVAFVFGNERFGLDPEVIKLCQETRILPLAGYKNSLNIANCVSIFIYEYARQFAELKL